MKNNQLLTVTREQHELIKRRTYFPFAIVWLTPRYADVPEANLYVRVSGKTQTRKYFAELLAQWATDNDDVPFQRIIAQLLGIEELFDKCMKDCEVDK